MKLSEMQDRLFNEIIEFKQQEMSKSQEDMYNDVYSIYAHQYIYDFLSDNLRDFNLSVLAEKRNIIEYMFDSYVGSDYQLNDDDLRDLTHELIEDEQRKMACSLMPKLYKKINDEFIEFKDSFAGATSDEIFEQSDKITFFNKMTSYIENYAFKYPEVKFLTNIENNTILSDIFEFVNSDKYEYDKNDYNYILSMYFIKNGLNLFHSEDEWEDYDEEDEDDEYKENKEEVEQE